MKPGIKACIILLILVLLIFSLTACSKNAESFRVEFKVDGETIHIATVKAGEGMVPPQVPPRTGYKGEWDIESLSKINENLVVNAVYTPRILKVLFKAQDSNNIMRTIETKSVSYATAITAIPAVPEKEGYSGVWSVTAFPWVTSDMEVFAIYTKNSYTISFETNGGTAIEDFSAPYQNSVSVSTAKEGYEFLGWYTDAALKNSYTLSTVPSSNLKLYAKWGELLYTVAINTGMSQYDTTMNRAFGAVIENLSQYARKGYKFNGWYTDSAFSKPLIFPYTITSSVTIYADWIVDNRDTATPDSFFIFDSAQKTISANPEAVLPENIIIPSVVGNVVVEKIAPRGFVSSGIHSVELPQSVSVIGDYAFASDSITAVTFDENSRLKTIGNGAFFGSSITSIDLPSSVQHIGNGAFNSCPQLTELVFADADSLLTVGALAFDNTPWYDEYINDIENSILYIGKVLYTVIGTLQQNVSLLSGTVSVSPQAFANQSSLTSMSMPDTLRYIGGEYSDENLSIKGAFYGCNQLVYLNFSSESQLEYTGKGVYQGCRNLRSLGMSSHFVLPQLFGNEAMQNAYTVIFDDVDYYLPETLETVKYFGNEILQAFSFAYTGIKQIQLFGEIKQIGAMAFFHCEQLQSFSIPDSVEVIDADAFSGCSEISEIILGENNSLKYIGQSAFAHLTKAVFNLHNLNKLETVRPAAFYDAQKLKTFNAPNLKKIGVYAFADCSSLEYLTTVAEISVPSLFALIQYDNSGEEPAPIIPEGFYEAGGYAIPLKLSTIRVANVYLPTDENEEIQDTICESFADGLVSVSALHIPENIKIIGRRAFYGLSITELTLPDTVVDIRTDAFANNAELVSVNISQESMLESFGKGAFSYCEKLTSLYLPKNTLFFNVVVLHGASSITEISVHEENEKFFVSDGALYRGETLLYYPAGKAEADYSIAEGTQYIGELAFANSKVKNLYLPQTLKSAAPDSFTECAFDKVSIYSGTMLERIFTDSSIINTLSVFGDRTVFGLAFQSQIKNLIVEEGVYEITVASFAQNTVLESVSLPESLRIIGFGAFSGCEKLSEIVFANADTLEQIAYYAFADTPWLNAFPDNEMVYVGRIAHIFLGTAPENTALAIREGTVSVSDDACAQQSNIVSVSFPESLIRIGDYAFSECDNLENITFAGNNLQTIGDGAFYYCSKLGEVGLSDTLKTIGEQAFYNTAIESIVIPASVEAIGDYVFANCILLGNISFQELSDDISFGHNVFLNTKWYNDKPNGLVLLSPNVIYSYKGVMPVNYILDLDTRIEWIMPYAFFRQYELVRIMIKKELQTIGEYAFADCPQLSEIATVSNSRLSYLGDYAFQNCIALTEFMLTSELTDFSQSVFDGCSSLSRIIVYDEVYSENYRFLGNILYNADKTRILYVPHGISGEVVLESTITEIEDAAFKNRTLMTSIVINNAIMSIGESAFHGCTSLEQVAFGDNSRLVSIGAHAFQNTSFTSITLPSKLTTIGEDAFDYYQAVSITFTGNNPPEIEGEIINPVAPTFYVPRAYLELYRQKLPFENIYPSRIKVEFLSNNNVVFSYEVPYGQALTAIPTPPAVKGHTAAWNEESLESVFDSSNTEFLSLTQDIRIHAVYQVMTYHFTVNGETKQYDYNESIDAFADPLMDGRQFIFWTENVEQPEPFVLRRMPDRDVTLFPVWFRFNFTLDNATDTWAIVAAPPFGNTVIPEHIIIPSSYQGKPVTAIIDGAFSFSDISQITLSDSIKIIGDSAFESSGLTRIVINNTSSLEDIGEYAFASTGISQINLPKTLQNIGKFAFAFCDRLQNIEFTVQSFSSIGASVFLDCVALETATINSLDSAPTGAVVPSLFENCKNLINVSLPENLNIISPAMFAGCEKLTNIYLSHIQVIEEYAFQNCISLASIELNEAVYIRSYAFENCISLQRVDFGNNTVLNTIDQYAFSECGDLPYFMLPASTKYIDSQAFGDCNQLKYLIIQENGNPADGVRGLNTENDFLPQSTMIMVGDEIDSSRSRWQQHSVELYRGIYNGFVAGVDNSLLLYVGSQTEVTLPASIESDRVEILGDDLFYGSEHITELTIADSYIMSLLNTAAPLRHLKGVVAYNSDSDIDGILYDSTGNILIAYPRGKSNNTFVVPEGVTTVADYAFYGSILDSISFASALPAEIFENTFANINPETKIYVPSNALTAYKTAPVWSSLTDRIFAGYIRHEDFLFVEHAQGLELARYIGADEEVSLPVSLNGKNIVSIADYAFYNSGIRAIAIPTSILYIGNYAFANNALLVSISLPESIKTLGVGAFAQCTALRTVSLPKRMQLNEISERAFSGCTALITIEIPTATVKIGKNAFEQCQSLSSVIFTQSNRLEEIGESAFYSCVALKNINIEIALKLLVVGKSAFADCIALEKIIIPEGVTLIGQYAFLGCDILKTVTFSGNSKLATIGAYAFYQNQSMEVFTVPASVTKIDQFAFFGNNFSQLLFASGSRLFEIGAYSFGESKNISDINLPKDIALIKEGAFLDSDSLRWITMSATNPPAIENDVWNASLRIYVPQNSLNIYKSLWEHYAAGINSSSRIFGDFSIVPVNGGAEIFQYLGMESNVEIPQTINEMPIISLGSFAFGNETLAVEIPESVTTLKAAAFSNCGLTTITLGKNIISIDENAFYGCKNLIEIILEEGNTSLVTLDNVLYNHTMTRLIAYPAGKEQNYFAVPQSVTKVGAGAFSGADRLINVSIPDSVTHIDAKAFDACHSLTGIIFEDATKLLFAGENAFAYTPWYLLNPDGIVYISSDGDASELVALNYKGQIPADADLTLNQNTVSILPGAFANNPNLKKLHIPSTVNYIGENVLHGCPNVSEITLPGEYAAGYLFGMSAFLNTYAAYNAKSGQTYYVPNSLITANIVSKTVADYAYSNIHSLTTVNINNSVEIIGKYAFFSATAKMSLENVVFESVFDSNLRVIGSAAFKDCRAIVNLTLPNNLKSINSYAFSGLSALRNLVLETVSELMQGELEYIGNNAFYGCTLLNSFFAPASLKYIGAKAFMYCTRMFTVNFYAECSLEEIGAFAFMNCTNLRSVVTSQNLKTIGDRAFYGCIALDNFNYDRSSEMLSYIGYEAFTNTPFYDGPQGLIMRPENQNSIIYFSKVAYSYNGTIPGGAIISLSSNTVSLSPYIFAGQRDIYRVTTIKPETTYVTVLVLNVTLKAIGKNAFFGNSGLYELRLPDGLETIEENAFGNCSALENVIFEDVNKLKYIGQDAFHNVPWYEDSVYGTAPSASVVYIGNIAYQVKDQVTSNTEIVLREGTVSITPYAFGSQPGLISIHIPSSIESIAQFSFGNHLDQSERMINTLFISEEALLINNLAGIFTVASKVILNIAPIRLSGFCAYSYTSEDGQGNPVIVTDIIEIIDLLKIYRDAGTLPDIYVPREYLADYAEADGWSDIFENILPYDGIFSDYVVAQNDTDGYDIVYYKGSMTQLVLPDTLNGKSVTGIRGYAFNTSVTNISGGNNITKLLPYAYAKSISLQSIELPTSLEIIGENAFENCSALSSIIIPASVKSIGKSAFQSCISLEIVELSEGLTDIGDFAFAYCARIVNITIPESVIQIGNNLFNDCMSLEIMIMKSSVPPQIGSDGLYRSTVKVYVPNSSLQAYRAAQNWKKYDDRTFGVSQMADVLISQDIYSVGEQITMNDAIGDGITVYIAAAGLSTVEALQNEYLSMLEGDFNNAIIAMPSLAGSFRVYVVIDGTIISVGSNIISVQEA